MNYLPEFEQDVLRVEHAMLLLNGVTKERARKISTNRYARLSKKYGNYGDRLQGRLVLRNTIDRHAERGEVGIAWSSMDCDHTYASGVVVVPANIYSVLKFEDSLYDDAEGPVSMTLTAPVRQRNPSRDLALEAYEDGHAHTVSTVRYETV
jgi:hypothetical protein